MWRLEIMGKESWLGISEYNNKSDALNGLKVAQTARSNAVIRVRFVNGKA